MLKLSDIPISILEECRKHKKLYERLILKAFGSNIKLLHQLQNQYGLNITDVGKHIQKNLEFYEHKCKTCGKHVHWDQKAMMFRTYCSAKCAANDPELKQRKIETNINKYGGHAPLSSDTIKEKVKKTNLEKYGVECVLKNENVKAKVKNTMIEKYGNVIPIKNKDIQDKIRQTNLEKYGCENPMQNDEIRKRAMDTTKERYGVDCILKTRSSVYGDIKLSDIPQALRDEIKTFGFRKRINVLKLRRLFKEAGVSDLLENIKSLYSLSDMDVYHHINLNYELCRHVCRVCGKPIGYDDKHNRFKEYCSSRCSNSDPKKIQTTKNNNLKKYGVTNPNKLLEIRQKSYATNLKKYGSKYTFTSKSIRKKIKKSFVEKYGVDNIVKSKESRDKMIASSKRSRREKTWKILEEKVFQELEPLFSKEELLNEGTLETYKFKCRKCGNIFDHDIRVSVTHIPICRVCHPHTTSMFEEEVGEFVASLTDKEIIKNTRSVIKPWELDIYIPELNLAFECNGNLWHSENKVVEERNSGKDNYHLNKTEMCEEKGIHLIHIFEWEWNQKKDLVKQRIRNLLDKNQERVFARKCVVKEIDNNQSVDFQNKYHLQGSVNSPVNLGLFYNDEIVGVMTFGKPRFNAKYEWELFRFCTSKPIIGGASKLLKHFEDKYKPKSLISYANRCWSSKLSNVYEKIGFNYVESSHPNYVYFRNDTIIPRYKAQKHKLKELLGEENFDPSLSETENMIRNRYFKLYDCGNLVFAKTYNNDQDKNI